VQLEPRVIPCLLLDGGALVKTQRFADPTYVGDPVNVLSIFNDFEVDEIVLLDIAAARSRRPSSVAVLKELAEECFIPLAYGGGLTSLEDMEATLRVGIEKVSLNSVLHDDPDVVSAAAARFGSQAVVGSIDVRRIDGRPRAVVHGGTTDTGSDAVAWARRAADLGVGEILLTSVDHEGTMEGYDLDLITEVAAAVTVPVIAHGGAGKRRHLATPVRDSGAAAVAAGSLFVFQGSRRGVLINYPTRAQITALLQAAGSPHAPT
jgi:imidazole glycerol-phosphate synthase subunit HisF